VNTHFGNPEKCSRSTETAVHHQPKSVFTFLRNERSPSTEIRIHDEYTASYQEQATEEEADLIPPAILSELPPLHFFARLSGGRTIKGRIPILR